MWHESLWGLRSEAMPGGQRGANELAEHHLEQVMLNDVAAADLLCPAVGGGCPVSRSETQLPVIVCNRTGVDRDSSFREAESALVDHGERIATLRSSESAVFIVEVAIGPTHTSMRLVDERAIPPVAP
jgi:hypothetical protein